ncbi:MAG: DAK2 domain-containing protein, partial [Oscillospiraceae bacterium]
MQSKVDAGGFCRMIFCASAAVLQNKQQINDLNVFPVPDGDTGTNMSLTIGCAAKELRASLPDSVGRAAEITANALLRGARGNSGVILSLLFRGFSRALRGRDYMDGIDFANALSEGVEAAYKAVMKPAEGTILTVSRLTAVAAREAGEKNSELESVMVASIEAAERALQNTVNQNPVLRRAGVIDAGGRGFVVILEGMLSALRGATEADYGVMPDSDDGAASFGAFTDEDIKFTYCTEFIVENRDGQDTA